MSGLKISLPGYDVETATPEQCAVHSDYSSFKIAPNTNDPVVNDTFFSKLDGSINTHNTGWIKIRIDSNPVGGDETTLVKCIVYYNTPTTGYNDYDVNGTYGGKTAFYCGLNTTWMWWNGSEWIISPNKGDGVGSYLWATTNGASYPWDGEWVVIFAWLEPISFVIPSGSAIVQYEYPVFTLEHGLGYTPAVIVMSDFEYYGGNTTFMGSLPGPPRQSYAALQFIHKVDDTNLTVSVLSDNYIGFEGFGGSYGPYPSYENNSLTFKYYIFAENGV